MADGDATGATATAVGESGWTPEDLVIPAGLALVAGAAFADASLEDAGDSQKSPASHLGHFRRIERQEMVSGLDRCSRCDMNLSNDTGDRAW